MENLRAVIGDQNIVNAFWVAVGSLAFSNMGLLVGAAWSHFKKIHKMRMDINEAHRKIRILNDELQKIKGENL